MSGFDMHIHSTASDGQLTAVQIIDQVRERGLLGLSITDHDTVAGLPDALAYAQIVDIPLIPGIELSAEYDGRDVHILGYWINFQSMLNSERLRQIKAAREERCHQIVRRLAVLGMPLQMADITASVGADEVHSLGRPHIALAMVEAKYVSSIKEAFNKWLSRGQPAYVPRLKFTPLEAMELIHEAEGVTALAHPGVGVPDNLIIRLVRQGLGGIEVYHSEHNRMAEKKYLQVARQYRLAALGGSDFHAPGTREIGSHLTSLGQLERLAAARMRVLQLK